MDPEGLDKSLVPQPQIPPGLERSRSAPGKDYWRRVPGLSRVRKSILNEAGGRRLLACARRLGSTSDPIQSQRVCELRARCSNLEFRQVSKSSTRQANGPENLVKARVLQILDLFRPPSLGPLSEKDIMQCQQRCYTAAMSQCLLMAAAHAMR